MKNANRFHGTYWLVICVTSFFLVSQSCNCGRDTIKEANKFDSTKIARAIEGELIVMYEEGASDQTKSSFRDSLGEGYVIDSVITCACNEDLEVWRGEGIERLLSDTSVIKGESAPSSRGGVKGDDSIFISRNLIITTPEGEILEGSRMPLLSSSTNNKVKIAVLDTGLDTALFTPPFYQHFLLKPSDLPAGCMPPGSAGFAGWNFVGDNANFNDDHAAKHGSNVTGLILEEGTRNWLQVLPLKTHGSNGQGNLFNILCALKFAKKAGVKYINASWGEYDSTVNVLMSRAVRELEASDIVLLAAAGNEGYDLDAVSFFPASYSNTNPMALSNVIAVTTGKRPAVCLNNNFSENVVDIAAMGRNGNCGFRCPFQDALLINGSSFATAVMTGKIANQDPYVENGNLKNSILQSPSLVPDTRAVDLIRTGFGYKQR